MNFIQKLHFFYRRWQTLLTVLGLAAISGIAVSLYLNTTSTYGIGVNSDSIAYVRAAENLVNGNGLGRINGLGGFNPMTHWPPLYSLVLATLHAGGMEIYAGARWLGAVLVFLLIFLSGFCLYRLTRSPLVSFMGAALLTYAQPQWETTLRLMSEPLFLVLTLLGVLCLDVYFERKQTGWLIGSGIWIGLAFLTRYAGFTLVAAAVLLLFCQRGFSFRGKVKSVLTFGLTGCLPVLGWLVYNQVQAGTGTNRVFSYTAIPPSDFIALAQTISAWFTPVGSVWNIGTGKLLFGGTLALLSVLISRLPQKGTAKFTHQRIIGWFMLLYAPIYAVFVLFSRLYFDSMIHIYRERITFPFYLAVFILCFWAATELWHWLQQKNIYLGTAILLVLSFTWISFFQEYRIQSTQFLKQTRNTEYGFAVLRSNPPELVNRYEELAPTDLTYSNNIELLWYLTGENALTLFEDPDPSDLHSLGTSIGNQSATFVIFNSAGTEKALRSEFPSIQTIYDSSDGAILILR